MPYGVVEDGVAEKTNDLRQSFRPPGFFDVSLLSMTYVPEIYVGST